MLATIILLLTLSKESAAGISAACTYEGHTSCIDYVGVHWQRHPEQARESCEGEEGRFSPNGSCKSSDRLGRCQMEVNTEMEFHLSFYPPIGLEQAEQTCRSIGGIFRP